MTNIQYFPQVCHKSRSIDLLQNPAKIAESPRIERQETQSACGPRTLLAQALGVAPQPRHRICIDVLPIPVGVGHERCLDDEAKLLIQSHGWLVVRIDFQLEP